MARPDSAIRRVTHLVGRFEQLSTQSDRSSSEFDGEDERLPSQHGEALADRRSDSPFSRMSPRLPSHHREASQNGRSISPYNGILQQPPPTHRRDASMNRRSDSPYSRMSPRLPSHHREASANGRSSDRPLSRTSQRPPSHHGEPSASRRSDSPYNRTSPQPPTQPREAPAAIRRSDSPFSRTTCSTTPPDTGLEAKLAEETRRLKALQLECEALRKRCREDEESREALRQKLEDSDLARQGYESQHKYMEGKLECLRQQLSANNETGQAEQTRADAEIEELRQQLALSEDTRQTDREDAKVEVQRQHNMLAVQLRDAEGRAEAALKKAQGFERQLLDLKQSMSTSTRVEKQVSDQEIAEKIGVLNHELQNWTVNAFRKVKTGSPTEMKKRFQSLPLLSKSSLLRSLFYNFDSSSKLFALQSTIVYLMMRVFEDDYFGLPDNLQSLQHAAKAVKTSTAPYNEWRSQTFVFLHRAEGKVKEMVDTATEKQKVQLVADITTTLSTLTGTKPNENQMTGLTKAIEHAIALSRLFSMQRAVYKCILPRTDDTGYLAFDEELMEDVFDAEAAGDRLIKCVTFPAVLKTGDEMGDNMNLRNVVVKAKVLCQADDEDEEEDEESSDY